MLRLVVSVALVDLESIFLEILLVKVLIKVFILLQQIHPGLVLGPAGFSTPVTVVQELASQKKPIPQS